MNPKIVIASGNQGKIKEFRAILAGAELISQRDLGIDDAIEDGLSFVENAIKKARHACAQSGLASIADDSGLEVDALNGAPGIYSARYAGKHASDADNINKLLVELKDISPNARQARFRCVIVYMRHAKDPSPAIFEGSWQGLITNQPQGANGFGYDPVFYVPQFDRTAAMLTPTEKNKISHRAKALFEFKAFWQQTTKPT